MGQQILILQKHMVSLHVFAKFCCCLYLCLIFMLGPLLLCIQIFPLPLKNLYSLSTLHFVFCGHDFAISWLRYFYLVATNQLYRGHALVSCGHEINKKLMQIIFRLSPDFLDNVRLFMLVKNVDTVQTMLRMFSFTDNVKNVQTFQTMLRMFKLSRQC